MIDKLAQEFKEHEVLLERGLKYEVDYIERYKVPFLPIHLPRKARKSIRLQQPTLATLSAIGREYLLFDIQEQLDLNKPYTQAAIMADKTAMKMSRVIATMATGIKDPAYHDTEKQDKEITALANLIFYNVKPALLVKLTQAVRMLCNIENFISSISHMSEIKKALPTLIEKEGSPAQ
jgi:hypothetical protein